MSDGKYLRPEIRSVVFSAIPSKKKVNLLLYDTSQISRFRVLLLRQISWGTHTSQREPEMRGPFIAQSTRPHSPSSNPVTAFIVMLHPYGPSDLPTKTIQQLLLLFETPWTKSSASVSYTKHWVLGCTQPDGSPLPVWKPATQEPAGRESQNHYSWKRLLRPNH